MSSALGPIHYWIFDQIGLVEGRGEALSEALAKARGEAAREAWEAILAEHPGRFSGRKLEELVSDGQIHQSLEAMMATVQAREAKLVAWAREHEGLDVLRRAYAAHGAQWGGRVREAARPGDAPAVFSGLRELWLEGMPCDIRIEVVEETPKRLRWTQPGLALERYWEGSGCPPETMLELHGLWMSAFVEAAADGFTWSMPVSAFAGADRFEFEIAES